MDFTEPESMMFVLELSPIGSPDEAKEKYEPKQGAHQEPTTSSNKMPKQSSGLKKQVDLKDAAPPLKCKKSAAGRAKQKPDSTFKEMPKHNSGPATFGQDGYEPLWINVTSMSCPELTIFSEFDSNESVLRVCDEWYKDCMERSLRSPLYLGEHSTAVEYVDYSDAFLQLWKEECNDGIDLVATPTNIDVEDTDYKDAFLQLWDEGRREDSAQDPNPVWPANCSEFDPLEGTNCTNEFIQLCEKERMESNDYDAVPKLLPIHCPESNNIKEVENRKENIEQDPLSAPNTPKIPCFESSEVDNYSDSFLQLWEEESRDELQYEPATAAIISPTLGSESTNFPEVDYNNSLLKVWKGEIKKENGTVPPFQKCHHLLSLLQEPISIAEAYHNDNVRDIFGKTTEKDFKANIESPTTLKEAYSNGSVQKMFGKWRRRADGSNPSLCDYETLEIQSSECTTTYDNKECSNANLLNNDPKESQIDSVNALPSQTITKLVDANDSTEELLDDKDSKAPVTVSPLPYQGKFGVVDKIARRKSSMELRVALTLDEIAEICGKRRQMEKKSNQLVSSVPLQWLEIDTAVELIASSLQLELMDSKNGVLSLRGINRHENGEQELISTVISMPMNWWEKGLDHEQGNRVLAEILQYVENIKEDIKKLERESIAMASMLTREEAERRQPLVLYDYFEMKDFYYHQQLDTLQTEYIDNIRLSDHQLGVDMSLLFSSLEELRGGVKCVHRLITRAIVYQFVDINNNNPETLTAFETLDDIFQEDRMGTVIAKSYREYCLNIIESISYLDRLKANPKFVEFLNVRQAQTGSELGEELYDLLLAPIDHLYKEPYYAKNVLFYVTDRDHINTLKRIIIIFEDVINEFEKSLSLRVHFVDVINSLIRVMDAENHKVTSQNSITGLEASTAFDRSLIQSKTMMPDFGSTNFTSWLPTVLIKMWRIPKSECFIYEDNQRKLLIWREDAAKGTKFSIAFVNKDSTSIGNGLSTVTSKRKVRAYTDGLMNLPSHLTYRTKIVSLNIAPGFFRQLFNEIWDC